MKNIAVLVSGGGTNLQALIDAQRHGAIVNGQITAVISSTPDAYALKRAEQASIPTYVIPRTQYRSAQEMTQALVEQLQKLNIHLVVMAGFMTIVTQEFFDHYANAVINIHPSLIPSFCGAGCYGLHVHEQALAYGVKLSGATVHFVTPECDAGPIIVQKSVEVLANDTPETLQKRIMEQCEWKLLPQAVSLFCQDKLKVQGRTVHILP